MTFHTSRGIVLPQYTDEVGKFIARVKFLEAIVRISEIIF